MESSLRKQTATMNNKSQSFQGGEDLVRAQAMWSAFSRVPEFREYAAQIKAAEFRELEQGFSRLSPGLGRGADADRLAGRLEKLAAEVQRELCQVEQQVVVETVAAALEEEGYLVDRRGGRLKATRGLTCVWAEVDPFAELALDMSGFSGLDCVREMGKIEKRLRAKGLRIERNTTQSHGRPAGGVLAQKLRPLFPEFKRMKPLAGPERQRERVRNAR